MEEKRKIENTLGMFDLLKGIAMLLMVLAHTLPLFPLVNNYSTVIDNDVLIKRAYIPSDMSVIGRALVALFVPFRSSMMPALLIVAGYGLRKRSEIKAIKFNTNELIKPYVVTAVSTVIVNIFIHYIFFRYFPGALLESGKVLGGMLLGLSQTTEFGSITFFANGPIWFLLTMFWAIVIFSIIINRCKDKNIKYVSVIISLIGWGITSRYTPLCLSQGLIGVIYVFWGYYLKKNKVFLKEYHLKEIIILIVFVIIPNIIFGFFGLITEMADNVYSLGPVNYLENGLFAIIVIYFFLRLNALRGKISNLIRRVGRYSLYIICVHTVEMISIPWYFIAGKFESQKIFGIIVLYITKLIIIFIGSVLVIKGTAYTKGRIMKWKIRKSLSQKQ